jgi:two-component system, sensor histidine kinase PdtaS
MNKKPSRKTSRAALRPKAVGAVGQARNSGRKTVALDGYLQTFSAHVVQVVPVQSRITLLVNADPVRVPTRLAGLIGRIVNELVINTIRHAFGPKRSGTIEVECGTDADGAIALQVGDDTRGHINGYGLRAPGTFGMQTVIALVKRLGGRLAVPKRGARVCYRITIPLPGRASSSAGR